MKIRVNFCDKQQAIYNFVNEKVRVNELKCKIFEGTGVPQHHQRLMLDGKVLRDEEFLVKNKPISAIKVQPTKLNEKHGQFLETTLLYDDLQGGACIDNCCGCTCVCRPLECIHRVCCFFTGCDLQFNTCQLFCWRCICLPTSEQKSEAEA